MRVMNSMRALLAAACVLASAAAAAGQAADGGRATFVTRCAGCHGSDGNGGELGPAISMRVPTRSDQDLTTLLREGVPAAGMPAFTMLSSSEATELIGFLRTLRPRAGSTPQRASLALTDGKTLGGVVLNQSLADLQLLGDDRKLHLLRKTGTRYRPVTSQTDWLTYNGSNNGSRYSPLQQISTRNVARLVPKWMFSIPSTARLQVTPVVAEGVMYVSSANEAYALDAGSGREVWRYQRPRT
jgi:alcohol dehydrogenase (cytochrome c)